jgi:hypothetical protein
MSPEEKVFYVLLACRYVTCTLMLTFVCIEAYKRVRHLVRRVWRARNQDWRDRAWRYAGALAGILLVIGGPVLFTLFHIAEINRLLA